MKQTPLKRKTPLRAGRWIKQSEFKRRSNEMLSEPRYPKRTMRRPKKHVTTPAEKEHLSRVASLRCLICSGAACIHHIRTGYGAAERASHWETLPLCRTHHQTGPMGVGFHSGPRTWQAKHGTEIALLKRVYDVLGIDFDTIPELCGEAPPWWKSYLRGTAMTHPASRLFQENEDGE